jgi:hypothetical protein
LPDNCPDGDYSPSYYDKTCGTPPSPLSPDIPTPPEHFSPDAPTPPEHFSPEEKQPLPPIFDSIDSTDEYYGQQYFTYPKELPKT